MNGADGHDAGDGRELSGVRRPPGPTRREVLEGLTRELREAALESPRVEAERLLAHATSLSRGELQLSLGALVEPPEVRTLARAVARRLAGEPLQHIEGTVEFRHLVLAADPRAFVPRPETEQLVERIVEWARSRRGRSRAEGFAPPAAPAGESRSESRRGGGVRPVRRPAERPRLGAALDIGTGSGAIALSLVREGVVDRVLAVDRSNVALTQAAENRELAGLSEEQVELRLVSGPLWEAVGGEECFDLIVSNPPYVTDEEMRDLPPEVRRDPAEALAGGVDGLEVIREILGGARERLSTGGALFLEIGEGQEGRVEALMERAGSWARIELARDLAGRVRFAIAESPEGRLSSE